MTIREQARSIGRLADLLASLDESRRRLAALTDDERASLDAALAARRPVGAGATLGALRGATEHAYFAATSRRMGG